MSQELVFFEQPVNERVRTFLRLEFLFRQFQYHLADESDWGRRAAVQVMLDILTLFSRGDLKKEIIRELGDQQTSLRRLEERPEVDPGILHATLGDLQLVLENLSGVSAQTSSDLLRDSEFLKSIINRSAIPGGACPFDLPGYRRWLSQSAAQCQQELELCIGGILPFRDAINLFLKLLRHSAPMHKVATEDSVYTQTLEGPCRLIRIALPVDTPLYPEISAGRQRFTVRFMMLGDLRGRDLPYSDPCEFGLSLCTL